MFRTAEDVSDNSEPMVNLTDAFRREYGDRVAKCDCSFWVHTAPEDVAAVSAALPSIFAGYPLRRRAGRRRAQRARRGRGRTRGGRAAHRRGDRGVAAALVVAQAIVRHIGAERSGSAALSRSAPRRGDVVRAWTRDPRSRRVRRRARRRARCRRPVAALPEGARPPRRDPPGAFDFDAVAVAGGALVVVLVTLVLAFGAAYLTVGRTRAVARPGRG